MSASDMSCIYSTLHYVCWQGKSYGVTPIITFDQPFFWKAAIIKASEPIGSCIKSIVLRLGSFHLQMSFLGSIGHLMAGSGLQELLETVYAANSVKHMLTGKAISRAIRGHLLVYGALSTMFVANAYSVPSADYSDEEFSSSHIDPKEMEIPQDDSNVGDLEVAAKLVDRLLDGEQLEEGMSSHILSRITAEIEKERKTLTNCRTAQVWFQYMRMVQILCRFIKAEHTGNWDLHLSTVHEMLPYFAASSHNLYTKSAYVYLQDMLCLEDKHPDVYDSFQNGHHVIRRSDRSDRYWRGLSTDLIIEQVLMSSVKSRGGMTRGRGMDETQRLVWLLGMPACAQVNLAMQTLTGVQCHSSEQHKDMGKTWKKRDMKDAYKLLDALKQCKPFASDTSLRGLVNGVTASESVNVDNAQRVGQSILDSMVGQNIQDYSFKRKCQTVTLGSKSAVMIKDEQVQVDPQLLFQRPSVIAGSEENPTDSFKYKLCSYPAAVFESLVLPRGANKASLAYAMWDIVKESQPESVPTFDMHYVIDGGALLQRLPWPRGECFEAHCQMYVDYVSRKYGRATVVFDGYADRHCAKVANTVLVGDDTDLLVLLCYHADMTSKDIFFRPEPKANSTKCRAWNIKKTKDLLGSRVCKVILFIHAILGCDSTSRLQGLGKGMALKLAMKDTKSHGLAQIFCGNSSKDKVMKAGEDALVILYNGSAKDDLDKLRYKRYCEKVKSLQKQ
ncbi:hypothetical protein GQR58_006011 [Nymphon striatum]|nr:hypothetical protein GQR58_006011 [Nymphon striatum]